MRLLKRCSMLAIMVLLTAFMVGCGCDGDDCNPVAPAPAPAAPVIPTVTFVSPANLAVNVPINTAVTATFSQAMDPATINNATFTLRQGIVPVAGTVAYAGLTGTFTPAAPLLANTVYTATITNGAANPAGNTLANNFVWTFTTGAAPDITRPLVTFVTPANLAVNVPINTAVTATFSEAMLPATINNATFTLANGIVPVAGTVVYAGLTGTFTPAAPLLPNTLYTATITNGATDLAGNALLNNFVWTFTTGAAPDTTSPTVTSVTPANLAVGVPLNTAVTATFSEAMNPTTISTATFTLANGLVPVAGTVVYAGLTGTFTPTAPLLANTVYTATITTGATDVAGNPLLANYIWTFTTGAAPDTTSPTVTFVTPANLAANVPINTAVTATFSEAMEPTTISTATFTLMDGLVPVAGTVVYAGLTGTFTPAAPLLANTVYTATITNGAEDLAGNPLLADYIWTFTTGAAPDTTSPTVTFVTPANLAVGVPLNTAVTATFSEAMLPATITTSTFTLMDGLVPVAGTVVYAGLTGTFTPAAPLLANTLYTATITTGATDLAGNPLLADYVWTFTTGAAPDTTNPTVVLVSPADLATNVSINTIVNASFSEAMDPTTINTVSFTLMDGILPVAGTVVYAGLTGTFTPAAPLTANTVYTATITTAAEDLAGNPLLADFVWSFTTGAAPDTTNPTVSFVAPLNLAVNVPFNTAVSATFSEAMNPATVNISTFTLMDGLVPVIGTVAYADLTGTFTPTVPLLPDTIYTATVTTGATDLATNPLLNDYVWTFTTGSAPDTITPTVIFVSPVDLATNVPVNSAVTATFSEAMDPVTINTGTFTLMDGLVPVAGTVTYAGLSGTFTPSVPLLFSTPYTATITTGATDLAGNALANDYVWSFTTGAAPDTISPTVILVSPADLATNVSNHTTVNATFSEVMDPSTISTATFTLMDGLVPVPGTVVYVGVSATFTPSAPLLYSTVYTATITTGAADLAGNHLASDFVWSFTTGIAPYPAPVFLGAADPFVGLSGDGISNVPTSMIVGDLGVSPASGTTITGFNTPLTCPEVIGTIYAVNAAGPACAVIDAAGLTAAKAALTVAYNDAAGRTLPAPVTVSGDLGGQTLIPGLYKSTSTLSIASGNLTLDGQGDANSVWIFQIASSFTTVGCGASVPCATGGNVMFINGADPANVFWQVGSAATVGEYTSFGGTILANDDISINTGANVIGRLLSGAQPSGAGAITLIQATLILP